MIFWPPVSSLVFGSARPTNAPTMPLLDPWGASMTLEAAQYLLDQGEINED